jgi:hypothetical protein
MKANKTAGEWEVSNHREKTSNQRVALIQLHTIKSLNNKKTKWQESPHTHQY